MSAPHYEELIQQCDDHIRAGHPAAVRSQLSHLNTAKVPREFRLKLARICRRSGIYPLGLKLLQEIVYPKNQGAGTADPAEIAEYGVLLLRSGAVEEALGILKTVDSTQVPEALLFRAYGHFGRWEFAEAEPLLQTYLNGPLSPYARAVGQANLAFALVESRRHQPALQVLEQNISWLEKNDHRQLLSNCFALRAQVYMQENNYPAARAEIENARKISASADTNDGFLVAKLDLFLRALETKSTEPLESLRALALKARDWESLREADLIMLKIRFGKERFLHLFFGTCFAGFRKLILEEAGPQSVPLEFILGPKNAPIFNLMSGEIEGRPALKSGTKCHQAVEILLRDLYRPPRIANLFSELFPGEHYDIVNSPSRVHQVLRRTRRWIAEAKLPFEIEEDRGFYFLRIIGEISFRLPQDRQSVEHMSLHFQALKENFLGGNYFTAAEVRRKLAVSKTTVLRLMNWGQEHRKIERSGASARRTKYKISDAA